MKEKNFLINFSLKKTKNIYFIIIVITLSCFLFAFSFYKKNALKSVGIVSIKYKTYGGNRWGKLVKNGQTSGSEKEQIEKIAFKDLNTKNYGFSYTIYNEKNPSGKLYESNDVAEFEYINGLSISPNSILSKKYDICYRTYNKTDLWLDWTCNDSISGNKKEKITMLQVKIIPKNVIRREYLEDYELNESSEKNFEE